MIEIIRFYNAVNDRAVTGTSGYDSSFLEKVNEVQTQAINTFAPLYEDNQAIKDALGVFVKPKITTTVTGTGLLAKEEDYVHFLAVLSAEGKTAFPINVNEISIIETSPIRNPDVSKGKIFYYQKADGIYFLPKTPIEVEYLYLRRPVDAKIVLNPVNDANRDYLVPSEETDDIVNLEWPESMFNLLMYMFLEKLGMEMKEPILIEYANLGITKEMINTDPQ